ncbi:MAG: 16S rRNA (cytosine(1402)-N(4))-methyltransferase RsmH [Deltaproteobacteria bacterium]|nr:16S rRNA (cytosine(1402)-N(4))-methyltransferase RsmH [Deltaproteobacteria bacterium]
MHVPVLLNEVLSGLDLKPGGFYVDGTTGMAGHSAAMLKACPDIRLLCLDWDAESLDKARDRLGQEGLAGTRVLFVQGNFCDLPEILEGEGIDMVDGILLDLGISSYQLDSSDRGFSFLRDAPLDMRMDRFSSVTAADMVNGLPEENLANLIYEYGEERWSRRIARAIAARRRELPFQTTLDLAHVIAQAVPRRFHGRHLHPATRTFQALRIAVNMEMDNLRNALNRLPACLSPKGRFCVISFHSLEDRMVKDTFRSHALLQNLTKKPITPSDVEISANPRSRSAKLRVAMRIDH